MRRIYEYLFVKKDPVLFANPHRKLIGLALMGVGTVHIVIGLVGLVR